MKKGSESEKEESLFSGDNGYYRQVEKRDIYQDITGRNMYICPECGSELKTIYGIKFHFRKKHFSKTISPMSAYLIISGRVKETTRKERIIAALSYSSHSRSSKVHKYKLESVRIIKRYLSKYPEQPPEIKEPQTPHFI